MSFRIICFYENYDLQEFAAFAVHLDQRFAFFLIYFDNSKFSGGKLLTDLGHKWDNTEKRKVKKSEIFYTYMIIREFVMTVTRNWKRANLFIA